MNRTELIERIQAVLEGVASADQGRELERVLAADPIACAEFEQWQRLFVALDRVPQAAPPEGLVAAITAAAANRLGSVRGADQLFERPDVIGYRHPQGRGAASRIRATIRRVTRSGSSLESENMSQQQRTGFGNRKLWVGGAVAVLAVGVAMIAFDLPPKSEDVTGTIAPAERYRAPQDSTEAVKLGDQTVAQLMQNDGFDKMIKDPQMKALSQDASIRMLSQILAKSPEAARGIMLNIDASKAASENVALARGILANVEGSKTALAAVQADRAVTAGSREAALVAALATEAERTPSGASREASLVATQRTDLARLMAANMEASRTILASVDASRAAVSNLAVAQAVLANVDASRTLLSKEAGRTLNSAEVGLMLRKAEASRTQLEKAASAESSIR